MHVPDDASVNRSTQRRTSFSVMTSLHRSVHHKASSEPPLSCTQSRIYLSVALIIAAAPMPVGAAEPPNVPDTLEQRIIPCTVCHGKQGEGLEKPGYYFPRIGAKSAGYLFRQLVNFREKRRRYIEMNYR